jgi:hypothetical protein
LWHGAQLQWPSKQRQLSLIGLRWGLDTFSQTPALRTTLRMPTPLCRGFPPFFYRFLLRNSTFIHDISNFIALGAPASNYLLR